MTTLIPNLLRIGATLGMPAMMGMATLEFITLIYCLAGNQWEWVWVR